MAAVIVTMVVDVDIDESKFDEKFMREFRASFYHFTSVSDHVEHIAQLAARGLLSDFTEGYGPIKDMGITAAVRDWETEVLP
jgi:hypothetical protein